MNEPIIQFSPGKYIAPFVDWFNTNLHVVSKSISVAVEVSLHAIEGALLALPPLAVIAIVAIAVALIVRVRVAVLAAVMLGYCLASSLRDQYLPALPDAVLKVLSMGAKACAGSRAMRNSLFVEAPQR